MEKNKINELSSTRRNFIQNYIEKDSEILYQF